VENSAEIDGFPQRKKKEQKERNENRPDGNMENAMNPRFPHSHRACGGNPKREYQQPNLKRARP
jgi:hypothetical protein